MNRKSLQFLSLVLSSLILLFLLFSDLYRDIFDAFNWSIIIIDILAKVIIEIVLLKGEHSQEVQK